MRRSRTLVVAAAAASTLMLAACNSGGASAGATPNNPAGVSLLKADKLSVCTHLSFKPFQFKDSSNKVVGFDVDLMDLVAKKLGVQQEIVDTEFAQITSGAVFPAKKCDIAMAGITVNDARKNAVQFSDPYFKTTLALMVKDGSPVKDFPDLKGKKLAIQTDTTGQKWAEANKEKYGYTTVVFDDSVSEMNAVLAGNVDAVINDNAVVFNFTKDNPGTTVVKEVEQSDVFAAAVKKDDANATKLAEITNEVFKSAKADGTYNTIYKKWFGVDAPKS